jgi:hypothetical protein
MKKGSLLHSKEGRYDANNLSNKQFWFVLEIARKQNRRCDGVIDVGAISGW